MSDYQPPYPPPYQYQPAGPPPKKPVNPWMIVGWLVLGTMILCGGGCGAVLGITALGSTVSTTTTTTRPGPSATAPVAETTTTVR